MTENLDLVVPAIARDKDRLDLFLASWRHNWKIPGKLYLFARDEEMHLFEGLASDPRIEVRTKRSLIGDAAYAPGANSGWYRQQVVKLAAHTVVQGSFYCCLDADFLVTQPVQLPDLITADGRGFAFAIPDISSEQLGWYKRSYEDVGVLMGVEPVLRDVLSTCPPFIFRKDISEACLSRLGDWQEVLARAKGWTEASLYRTTAEITGAWTPSIARLEHSLTDAVDRDPRAFIAWDPTVSFSKYKFVTVSGANGVPAHLIKQKLISAGVGQFLKAK